jgi:uncharacterized protein with PQ loop repeat
MPVGMPHSPLHVTTKKKSLKKKIDIHPYTGFDRLVLVISVMYPLSAIPQIIAVFNGRTDGVSVLSWIFFLVCSTLFFIYGVRRHVSPMIVANSIWVLMDALVIYGVLASGSTVTWI